MTKAQEQGENEYTDAARREAAKSGRNVCDLLAEWLAEAKMSVQNLQHVPRSDSGAHVVFHVLRDRGDSKPCILETAQTAFCLRRIFEATFGRCNG